MDAPMTRAHHPGVEVEEDHHEKKSILKKVKARAKKVKDTLATKAHVGHGHGNDHEREYEHNQEEEGDGYDEDDDELVQDSEIHGAPMYDSAAAKNFAMGSDVNASRATADPTPTLGENVCPGTFQTKVTDPDSTIPAPSKYDSVAAWDSSLDHDAKAGQFKGTLGDKFKHADAPTGTLGDKFQDTDVLKDTEEDSSPIFPQAIKLSNPVTENEPASPKRHGVGHEENSGFFKSPLGVPLDEPPRDVFSLNTHKRGHDDVSSENYQGKGPDFGGNVGDHDTGILPTEAGFTPILHSFDKMAIYDEPKQHEETITGSHDQFSPSAVPDKQFIPESFGVTTDPNHPQDMNVDQSNSQQGGYTGKVSSVASAVADKAISAKNAVASKIGYAGNDQNAASQNVGQGNISGVEPQCSPSPVPDRQFIPGRFGVTNDQDQPQDMNVDQSNTQQGGYTGKVSTVASAVADKAISAKNVVASKIGYGGNDQNVASQNVGEANVSGLDPPRQQQQSTYTEKLSSATGVIADKATAAKNVVASKLGYGGTGNSPLRESEMDEGENANVQPGGANVNVSGLEPPKPQGTYTDKLSSAAASAKNAVASKLGYGGTDATPNQGTKIYEEGDNASSESGGGVTGYGKQIASTVTGKLAPVYGTVAGAGSAVLSKLPGTGMGTQHKTGEDAGIGVTHEMSSDDVAMGATRESGADKGVGMKGCISEKLRPSDEDKALSDMISGALHMRGNTLEQEKRGLGEAEGTKGVPETVKDALHKRNTDEGTHRERMDVPLGKVAESEEVANRLGSSEEERMGKVYPGTGNECPSTGVVDKVKGAFTNWFGKGGEMNPSMAFNDQNTESSQGTGTIGEENASGEGERRLQAN